MDYRNKYLGDYSFSVHLSSYMYNIPFDTSYINVGKIDYGSYEHEIVISLSGGLTVYCSIYEDGTLRGNNGGGEFETTNKCIFNFDYGGHFGHTYYELIGERK